MWPRYLQDYFFPEGPEQVALEEILSEKTIEKIYERAQPIYYELDKQNLVMVNEDYNEVIKEGGSELDVRSWLDDNKVKHEFLTEGTMVSNIMVLSDTGVIVFMDGAVYSVFTIEDKKGNNIDPYTVLKGFDEKRKEENRKASEEYNKEYYEEKRAEEKEMERKKEAGPKIGMIDSEVAEIFGKPSKINRTTTANGIREQWVYRDYKYLYFEDGILTTIQE